MPADVGLSILFAETGPIGDRTMTVRLSGDLDCVSVALFRDLMARRAGGGHARLVFDVAELSFLDCAGARALVRAGDHWAGGERPVLRCPSWIVLRALRHSGLDSQLTIEAAAPGSGAPLRPGPGAAVPAERILGAHRRIL